MALKCPNCQSTEVQAGLADSTQCRECGKFFNSAGDLSEPGPDQSTRDAAMERLAPRQQVVVGNIADLQRLGAAAASGDKATTAVKDSVVTPENQPHENVTPAEAEAARGRTTRETERTGEKVAEAPAQPAKKAASKSR